MSVTDNEARAVDADHPHGRCGCANGNVGPNGCCGGRGPAAFSAVRDGQRVLLCTRCDLTRDKPTRKLLVTHLDSLEPYGAFDLLGAFVLAGLLATTTHGDA